MARPSEPGDTPSERGDPAAPLAVHPVVRDLRRVIAALREEIGHAYLELQQLLHVEKPLLLARYQALLGPLELEALELSCRVNRLRRKLAMLHAAHNRGARPDLAAIEAELQREFAEWQARIAEAIRAIDEAERWLRADGSEEEAREFRALFRKLVLALHPDLHPAQGDHERVLWRRVLSAYENGDLGELRTLMTLAAEDVKRDAVDEGPDALTMLERERERLKAQLASLAARVDRVKAEPPFDLRDRLEDAAWLDARRTELTARCAELRKLEQQLEIEVTAASQAGTHGNEFGPN